MEYSTIYSYFVNYRNEQGRECAASWDMEAFTWAEMERFVDDIVAQYGPVYNAQCRWMVGPGAERRAITLRFTPDDGMAMDMSLAEWIGANEWAPDLCYQALHLEPGQSFRNMDGETGMITRLEAAEVV